MKLYDLKLARDRAGLTQEDIAESLDVSRQAVSMWETGKKSPSSRNLKKLADLLNVSVDSLLRGDKLMSAPSEDNKKAPAGSPGEGDNYGIQLNNSANSGTITQTVTPSPHAAQSSDDLEAALRLRRDRPEVVKMLPDPDYSDDMIRAVYERTPKSAKQG